MNTPLHKFFRVGLAVGLPLSLVGCERDTPLAPNMLVAARAGSGGTVNAPSGTNAVARSYNQIDVSWIDNSSNESGFEVHRSTTGANGVFTLVASTGANVTSFGNGGLAGSSEYCYEVRAFRITGSKKVYSTFSGVACATTLPAPVPPAPSGVNASLYYNYAISVTWIDNSSNESGFRVERSATGAGPWTTVSTTGSNVTSITDYQYPGDEQGVCYRVFAFNSFGDSGPSSVDCTTPPAAPTNLAGTPVSGSAVDLSWTDNSAVEDGYEVRRAGEGADWSVVATLPANTSSYHDASVSPDQTYWYVVRATKDGGFSGNSNFAQVVVATTPPLAPANADALPASSSSVAVYWSDIPTNEAGFRIERSVDGGASWAPAGSSGANEPRFTDGPVASEQLVCYRVIAFNGVGESPPSNTDCTTPPAGPTGLTVTVNDDTSIDLAWTDNSGVEDGYEVWVDAGDGNSFPLASLPPNTTSFPLSAGWCGYCYWHYVVAIKDGGYSDFSNVWIGPIPPPAGASSVRPGSTSRTPAARRPAGRRVP